jgi:hypothetical protein
MSSSNGGGGGFGGLGGGIASDLGLSVLNSTIANNIVGPGGPGGNAGDVLYNCSELGCALGAGGAGGAGGGGGGVAQIFGGATLTNLTIADNQIGSGASGGEELGGGGATLAATGAPGAGEGVLVRGGSLTEANTIVQNTCSGTISDAGGNLATPFSSLVSFQVPCPGLSADPLLGPLQNNGGLTETMALSPGSAAIDQVPATTTTCPATDQRGYLRPDGEGTCDIGAYESGASPLRLHLVSGLTLAPRYFALQARGTEQRGVTVTALLHKPRVLVLVVHAILRRRLVLVGLVRLGHHHAGRSEIHWNLYVRGRLLPPGRFQVIMDALDDGFLLSPPANPGARTLIVQDDGQVRP